MTKILQLTDTHLFADPEGSLYSVNTRASLTRVIGGIKEHSSDFDAVLLTGDLVHDESHEGYLALKAIVERLGKPMYCLPGNHDDLKVLASVFKNSVNEELLCVDVGSWSIVLLDTSLPGKVEGGLSDTALHKLEQYLSGQPQRNTMLATHHHIIDVGSPWLDALNLRNHARLTEILAKHAQVKLVINGHVHQEIDDIRSGVRYLGSPSTCFQFKVNSENGGADDRPPGYRTIILNDDGSLDTEVVYIR